MHRRSIRTLRRALAGALVALVALPIFASSAGAADVLAFQSVWFETRPWFGPVPANASDSVAIFNSLPTGQPGYCAAQVTALAGANNQGVCGGTSSWMGYYASVEFDAGVAGQWNFRLGPDFGGGGALLVDGIAIDFHQYDTWWNYTWDDPSQTFQGSIVLAPGAHVFELYGFEGCCDGPWGAQLRAPGGQWTDISGAPLIPSLRPQTIVFGSTPPTGSAAGATYTPVVNGGASGNPVVLSTTSANCAVSGSTVTATGGGTCVILADQAGNDRYLSATQGSQTWVIPITHADVCRTARLYADGGLGNSLCAKLNAAAASSARGNAKAAANQLDAFRSEVKAQTGKKLTGAQAAHLLALVGEL